MVIIPFLIPSQWPIFLPVFSLLRSTGSQLYNQFKIKFSSLYSTLNFNTQQEIIFEPICNGCGAAVARKDLAGGILPSWCDSLVNVEPKKSFTQ